MLKMTGVKLEKILDIDKYIVIEKGLRGGNCYIAKRYTKANNKYKNYYHPKKPSTFITYVDMNNFYGWAMSEYLPYAGVKCLENIDEFDMNLISEKCPIGYFLEVGLEYPDELHKLHNDYHLAPEKIAASSDMLSNYCKIIAGKYVIRVGNLKGLIPNLGNKTNYVVHYRNLQLYLSLGMKLTKIDRVLKFKQSDWIKKYIDFNTEEKMNAAKYFEK